MRIGSDQPLYVLPFDQRGTFPKNLFGWKGELTAEQTAAIAATKLVIYGAFKAVLAGGVAGDKAEILVGEPFGVAIRHGAARNGCSTSRPAGQCGQDEFDF